MAPTETESPQEVDNLREQLAVAAHIELRWRTRAERAERRLAEEVDKNAKLRELLIEFGEQATAAAGKIANRLREMDTVVGE